MTIAKKDEVLTALWQAVVSARTLEARATAGRILADCLDKRGQADAAQAERALAEDCDAGERDPLQEILLFRLAEPAEGGAIELYQYSPNGGMGDPTGDTNWASEDYINEILDEDWDSVEWTGERLELHRNYHNSRSVIQHIYLTWKPDPSQGLPRLAYLGSGAGFIWEDCPEEWRTEKLEKALTSDLRWDEEELAKVGLACCDDYDCGDDGGYWLIADRNKLAAFVVSLDNEED